MTMAFRRGGLVPTPPSVWIFAVSLVLAVIALLVRHGGVHVPTINAARVGDVLAIAYAVLAAGVLVRRMWSSGDPVHFPSISLGSHSVSSGM